VNAAGWHLFHALVALDWYLAAAFAREVLR
jgi:hypothetical protein